MPRSPGPSASRPRPSRRSSAGGRWRAAAPTRRLTETEELAGRRLLAEASRGWVRLELSGPVIQRAWSGLPAEPVRTLDALHLAPARLFDEPPGGGVTLALDERIRANASAMGMEPAP